MVRRPDEPRRDTGQPSRAGRRADQPSRSGQSSRSSGADPDRGAGPVGRQPGGGTGRHPSGETADGPAGRQPDRGVASGRGGGSSSGRGGGAGLTGISGARAYTPRGRTVRDTPELRRGTRAGRTGDPFRPALQVLDGGRGEPARSGRSPKPTGRTAAAPSEGAGRTLIARPARPGRTTGVPRPRRPSPGDPPRAGRPRRRPPLADPRRRLRLGTLLVLTMFAVIGIRLVVLQVVDAPAYADGGVADRLRTVVLPAPRGAIYDRSGAPLAHSVEARYVFADPELVTDPAGTAAALSPLLGISRSDLMERMKRQQRPGGGQSRFEYLARGVEIETAEKIMALKLDGIGTDRDERREVPGGDLAANLLGFTSQDMRGLEGLEARYDELLRGRNGERQYEVGQGRLGAEIPGGHNRVTEARPGSSLGLTIDRDLQYEVQRILAATMTRHNGSTGAAVVLDIRTGEVLAQASHPTYDAAAPTRYEAVEREDAATSFVIDPGSVHKAIIFAAGLEEKVITPDTVWPVPSAISKGGVPFSDVHDAQGRRMTVAGMLGYSSNIGTIRIADRLGADKVVEYQRRFGLGEPTGEGVPGEASGRVLPVGEWSGSAYGSVPIGHSVDVTPVQMAAVYAAIANDGTWVQPHLVRETIGPDGKREPAPPPRTRRVISPASAAALRQLLEAPVALPDGTGQGAAIPGYRVAGKTGTGKRIVDGRYVAGDVASFIGMDQADHPRYVVAVFAHTPNGGGGDVAGPAFRQMMAFTLTHYRVPPTGAPAPKFVVYPR